MRRSLADRPLGGAVQAFVLALGAWLLLAWAFEEAGSLPAGVVVALVVSVIRYRTSKRRKQVVVT